MTIALAVKHWPKVEVVAFFLWAEMVYNVVLH